MEATIIITNSHARGFSFGHAIEPVNEQVFIPAHVAAGMDLQPSDRVEAVLVPNYADKSHNGTAYMAVKVSRLNADELNVIDKSEADLDQDKPAFEVPINQDEVRPQELSREEIDEKVLEFIEETTFCTTSEISENLSLPHKTVGNSAMRAFNAGLISRAEVYGRVGMRRPSFVMWAKDQNRFIDYA
jgi:DNA-binding transcriptional ArsR family regulator